MHTIKDLRPRQIPRVLLLPEIPNLDGEPRAAIRYPGHPRAVLFHDLAAALTALREAREAAR